jgi:hypothetical protein
MKKWDALVSNISEGVHSLCWAGQEEESWWKIGIVVGRYQWVLTFMRCECTVRHHPLLWITRIILRVIFY